MNIIKWDELAKEIQNPAIIISSCRRSGKTHLARDLLYQINKVQKFDIVFLFCETADYNEDFEYISPNFKYNKYEDEILRKIIEKQEEIIKQNKKDKEKNTKILIILDDVASSSDLFYSEEISKLFTLGRHLNISVVYLTQHLSSISPKQRKNCDVLIAFKDVNKDNKKTIIKQFMSMDNEKNGEEFYNNVFDEPYKCICICVYKVQKSNELKDFVHYYKAPEIKPKFKLGNVNFFTTHEEKEKNEEKDGKKYTRGVKMDITIAEDVFKKIKNEYNKYTSEDLFKKKK
jgi:hypothetical protein